MSRKRKADQDLSAVGAKRNGHQVDVSSAPRSARSAIAARQLTGATPDATVETPSGYVSKVEATSAARNVAQSKRDQSESQARAPTKTTANRTSTSALPLHDAGLAESSSDEEDGLAEDGGDDSPEVDGNWVVPIVTEAYYPRSWRRAREMIANEILSQKRTGSHVLTTGTANAGTSTFAEYLTNTLLRPPEELGLIAMKSIGILHLDPATPWLGPIGHVSMSTLASPLGRDHGMHIQKIRLFRSIPVGLFGQQENSDHFIAAVEELLREFQQLNITMPLVICCPSVERESEEGMQTAVLQELMNLAQADHFCYLSTKSPHAAEVLDMITSVIPKDTTLWEMETLLDLSLPPMPDSMGRRIRASKDYFHQSTSTEEGEYIESLPVSQQKPYAISYTDRESNDSQNLRGCFIFGDIPPNHAFMLSRVLNGSLVAIVSCPESSFGNSVVEGEGDEIPYFVGSDGGNPDPTMLLRADSIGLGLVRSIDHAKGIMYINTPEHVARKLQTIASRDILLVHGVADSPGWAYKDDFEAGLWSNYLGQAKKGMRALRSRRFKKRT